jgi:AraC family transcriptional regulator
MKAALRDDHARMHRAVDHIDRHLNDDLGTETVNGIADFSKFHFRAPVGPLFTRSRV